MKRALEPPAYLDREIEDMAAALERLTKSLRQEPGKGGNGGGNGDKRVPTWKPPGTSGMILR